MPHSSAARTAGNHRVSASSSTPLFISPIVQGYKTDKYYAVFLNRHISYHHETWADFLEVEPDRLITLEQTHQPNLYIDTTGKRPNEKPEADAVITNVSGAFIGVKTADCVPILLADRQGRGVGAIHASWMTTRDGLIEKTVTAMEKTYDIAAKDITAYLGPSIHQESYEFGKEQAVDLFKSNQTLSDMVNPQLQELFDQNHDDATKGWLDMPGLASYILTELGVKHITQLSFDTFQDHHFNSYRRHYGEPDRPRENQLSAICLL